MSDAPRRSINPHLARAAWFLAGVVAAAATVLEYDSWLKYVAAVALVFLGHGIGARAFERLATRQEIIDDLRHRADTSD